MSYARAGLCLMLHMTIILNFSTYLGCRFFSIYSAMVFWFLLLPGGAAIAGQFGDFNFQKTTNATITITAYTGSGKDVIIPDSIENLPVTIIGVDAFNSCSSLVNLTLPNGITEIGNWAFNMCTGLTNVFLPKSLVNIGNGAFDNCVRLKGVALSGNITNIGSQAFFGCSGLTCIDLPKCLTTISGRAFAACIGLTNLNLPDGLTNIGIYGFSGCLGLTNVSLSKSIISIDNYAFFGCTNLSTMYFSGDVPSLGDNAFSKDTKLIIYYHPASMGWGATFGGRPTAAWFEQTPFHYEPITSFSVSITQYNGTGGNLEVPESIDAMTVSSIGDRAFYQNKQLTGITLPGSVTNIGNEAFYGCTGITNIDIGANVNTIGTGAFGRCDQLKSFRCSMMLTNIGNYVFSFCTSLTTLHLPKSLLTIGDYAFFGCTELDSLYFEGNAPALLGDFVFLNANSANIYYLAGATGWNDFYGGRPATTWNEKTPFIYQILGDTAIAITKYIGVDGSVGVPTTIDAMIVASIGDRAFSDCTGLTNFTLPDCVTNIGQGAFSGCIGLRDFYVGASVTGIGTNAFAGCTGLANIWVDNNNPILSSLDGILFNKAQSGIVLCPPGRQGYYAVPGSVVNIHANCFAGCGGLTNITMTNGVVVIGEYAFSACSGLTSLYLPSTVTTIGGWAFDSCAGLTNLTLSRHVAVLGKEAFANCRALTSLQFKGNAPLLEGEQVFENTTNVTVFYLDGTLGWSNAFGGRPTAIWTETPPYLYQSLSSNSIELTRFIGDDMNATVPETIDGMAVIKISDSVFAACTGLTSVVLPGGLTNIAPSMFSGCLALTNISISPQNPYYSDIDGVVFNKDQSVLLLYPLGKTGSYKIPTGTKNIGDGAFWNCGNLAGIIFPTTVTNIGNNAFANCSGLTSVNLPGSLTAIGDYAFNNCLNLSEITTSDGLASIGTGVFMNCNRLQSVILPASLSSIGDLAFAFCYWSPLNLYFNGNAPLLKGYDVFRNSYVVCVFYVDGSAGWNWRYLNINIRVWVEQTDYLKWATASGLSAKYPQANSQQDDPDQDGLTNIQEQNVGTDPTDTKSTLAFEAAARPADLENDDKTPLSSSQFALYVQTVPGKTYDIQSRHSLDGAWNTAATVTASTTQKRVVLQRPKNPLIYRVVYPTDPSVPPDTSDTTGMVGISGGTFTMGDTLGDGLSGGYASNEWPAHVVSVSAFSIDKTEINKGLWDAVYQWAVTNGYSFDSYGAAKGAAFPVCSISWFDAVKWCNARSEKEGRTPAYYTNAEQTAVYRAGQVNLQTSWVKWNSGYRLPTEAEWEKAARGGASGHRFPWSDGNTITHNRANYYSSSVFDYDVSLTREYHPKWNTVWPPFTNPGGSFLPNAYGLYDMAGNVSEWCWDWYDAAYYEASPAADPKGPASGTARVRRGGSWIDFAWSCRSACRSQIAPESTSDEIGFRTVVPSAE